MSDYRIWKYPLELTEEQVIWIPLVQFLHVDVVNGRICVWALVEPRAPKQDCLLEVLGTGVPVDPLPAPQVRKHLGTVISNNIVLHVFHRTTESI